jgi:acyl-CoA thioester hydrolase
MNNVVYLQWMEQLAWAHSAHLGLGWPEYQRLDAAMVAREHHLSYQAACFVHDVLDCQTWLEPTNGLRLVRHYRFVRQSDQLEVFLARTMWVCVRLSTGKALRMPDVFRLVYGSSEDASPVQD